MELALGLFLLLFISSLHLTTGAMATDFPSTSGNEAIHIDTQADLNGNWEISCSQGYAKLVSDFNCENGGRVNFPEEDLHDQVGFWTACENMYCRMDYIVQPGDTSFAARIYQRNNATFGLIGWDAGGWEWVGGEGWIDINRPITGTRINIWLGHTNQSSFSVLDRIAINAELPPLHPGDSPSTPTESWTSPPSSDSPTTPADVWTTTLDPVAGDYCPAHPNATEALILIPHIEPTVSYSCGDHFDCSSGGIFYKPFEAVLPNERCIWTVAVPSAKGYDVTIQYFGYQPEPNNDEGHGLIISDFGHSRAPTHFIPTTTNTTSIMNSNMLLITFFTGSEPTPNHSGFILQFKSRTDGQLDRVIAPSSKHEFVTADRYFLHNGAFAKDELSTYIFLPRDNIHRPKKENRAVYMWVGSASTVTHYMKIYYFNTTCVGPHKWEYQGQIRYVSQELIRSAEPMLVIFETNTVTGAGSFWFTYSASCDPVDLSF